MVRRPLLLPVLPVLAGGPGRLEPPGAAQPVPLLPKVAPPAAAAREAARTTPQQEEGEWQHSTPLLLR